MIMEGKLDIFGSEYLKTFRDELDIVEKDGVYNVSGTDASGRPISTTLTTEDLNKGRGVKFNYVLGVVRAKQNAKSTGPELHEHRTIEDGKRVKKMEILLDVLADTDKYPVDPKPEGE